MPRKDETGPVSSGTMTGSGFGSCAENALAKRASLGLGFRLSMTCRRGFRRFSASDKMTSETRREILQVQKDALKNRLAVIDLQLKSW